MKSLGTPRVDIGFFTDRENLEPEPVLLDIKLVRENPEIVRESLRKRGLPDKLDQVELVLKLDAEWRHLQAEADQLRKKRNEITAAIAEARKRKQEATALMKEAQVVPENIKDLETKIGREKEKIENILMNLPNIIHESVPFGKNEDDNVEVRKWGSISKFDFKALDHIDLGLKRGLIDIERAGRVAGARFYYLREDLVRLNHALIQYGLDFVAKKGFQLYQPPYFPGCRDIWGNTVVARTAAHVWGAQRLLAYVLISGMLERYPRLRVATWLNSSIAARASYAGISPCFRKEAGAHGRDTKGIFRVHQFEKVEMFLFSTPEDSWKLHEELLRNLEEFFQSLKIPHRIVNVCTGDLGTVAAKKYDLEAWLPGQGKYREMASCSNCTSYQAVRSKVRYREKPSLPTKYAHTLNSTLVATERAIVAIMENNQTRDGTIEIPHVLQDYMNGQQAIPQHR